MLSAPSQLSLGAWQGKAAEVLLHPDICPTARPDRQHFLLPLPLHLSAHSGRQLPQRDAVYSVAICEPQALWHCSAFHNCAGMHMVLFLESMGRSCTVAGVCNRGIAACCHKGRRLFLTGSWHLHGSGWHAVAQQIDCLTLPTVLIGNAVLGASVYRLLHPGTCCHALEEPQRSERCSHVALA
jgi:hypothetical protein